jgi:hypothetical protein
VRSLARPPYGDITDTDQGDGILLLLEYALVKEGIAYIYPDAIQPREEVK